MKGDILKVEGVKSQCSPMNLCSLFLFVFYIYTSSDTTPLLFYFPPVTN
jgi:hypothetical protein